MENINDIDYSVHYKRWHRFDDEYYKKQAKFFDCWLSQELSVLPRKIKVLDYGCGAGFLINYLIGIFEDVLGVDSSKEQVALAKQKNLPVFHLAIDDFDEWCNRHENEFDVIFLMDVLEHVPVNSQINFTRMLVKVLKVNGTIFIKVPNANSLLSSRWRYIDHTHHSSFTEASLEFICVNAQLTAITPLQDESSFYIPLKWYQVRGIIYIGIKTFFRFCWKLYLRSELGSQARQISVGYNLFIKASKHGN
jgi:2-polyprenyl-3-methyl-5-hydroxy-6-metoxy-1,4-benzoquinol methylase